MEDHTLLQGNTLSDSAESLQLRAPRLRQIIHFKFLKDVFCTHTRMGQMIIDAAIFASTLLAAYLIRFEDFPKGTDLIQLLIWLPLLAASRVLLNHRLGVYNFIWRFVCLSDAIVIGASLAIPTSCLLALRLLYPVSAPFAALIHIPLTIIVLEFLLSLVACLAARGVRRILYEQIHRSHLKPGQPSKRVVLYGAGRAGVLLLRELETRRDIEIVGFVDDDPAKVGTVICGARVLGAGQSLESIVRRTDADEVLISIAVAAPGFVAKILSTCSRIPVTAKIIPTLEEILSRRVNISHVREVRLEDLLGRDSADPIKVDDNIRRAYTGMRILVTGAGGSIGSELVRQLQFLNPRSIAVLDKDENSIYDLDQEMKLRGSKVRIEPIIADLRDRDRLASVMTDFKPQVVFHAAAHKHVPLMEKHPCEAILNNVCGTMNLLKACRRGGVERFVFISSDKAVNPANVMGATKRLGEMLVQAHAGIGMRLACVRFGNVIGSRGSVIPLFQRQIENGGPITITHPDVVRFFMTIPEASQLVICAGSLASKGEIFVLDMGSPRKILDLANQLLTLSGLQPGKDIEIEITGLRPGEKMREEMVGYGEQVSPTRFEKISMLSRAWVPDRISLFTGIAHLVEAAQRNDHDAVREVLSCLHLGFVHQPSSEGYRRTREHSVPLFPSVPSRVFGENSSRISAVGHDSLLRAHVPLRSPAKRLP
jgi:FlaA1/EpsC-like NDP-sugar epimerase